MRTLAFFDTYGKHKTPVEVSLAGKTSVMNIGFLLVFIEAIYPALDVDIRHLFASENIVVLANDLISIPDDYSQLVFFRLSWRNIDLNFHLLPSSKKPLPGGPGAGMSIGNISTHISTFPCSMPGFSEL